MAWKAAHHWAGVALQAAEAAPDVPGWTVRIATVIPDTAVRGGPANAARSIKRLLAPMRATTAHDFLRWDDDLHVLTGCVPIHKARSRTSPRVQTL